MKQFIASYPRAPWFIQSDSDFTNELFKVFSENLSSKGKKLTIKLKDQSMNRHFFWEQASS